MNRVKLCSLLDANARIKKNTKTKPKYDIIECQIYMNCRHNVRINVTNCQSMHHHAPSGFPSMTPMGTWEEYAYFVIILNYATRS